MLNVNRKCRHHKIIDFSMPGFAMQVMHDTSASYIVSAVFVSLLSSENSRQLGSKLHMSLLCTVCDTKTFFNTTKVNKICHLSGLGLSTNPSGKILMTYPPPFFNICPRYAKWGRTNTQLLSKMASNFYNM